MNSRDVPSPHGVPQNTVRNVAAKDHSHILYDIISIILHSTCGSSSLICQFLYLKDPCCGHQEVDEVDNATAGFGEFTDALQVKVTAGHAQLRIQLFQDRTESELLGQVGSPGPKGPPGEVADVA